MKSRQSRCHRVHKAMVIDSQSLSLLVTDCQQPHRCSSLLLFEMSTPSKKRKVLTIDVKLQILANVNKKAMTKKEIAAKYDIPHNSLSTTRYRLGSGTTSHGSMLTASAREVGSRKRPFSGPPQRPFSGPPLSHD
ncbi:hypothetical protein PoB_001992700 [Plakobranchus ocellatus]|uniref:HTH psq-type domain-containing protein n=1 Tax=Plakobranchus ocellatus TaxID=259542 RepID=A0AAV3ZDS6_9GAST|nr:hypothetical protein PoB_001992700 [Plakobranchus ocellatus]